jgi:hypothetical protein
VGKRGLLISVGRGGNEGAPLFALFEKWALDCRRSRLVKKGLVAQFDSTPERNMQRIFVDGYNNPGFSGSPLVYRDLSQSGLVFKVAGVIVSYEADDSPVLKKLEIRENQITAEDRAKNRVRRTTDGRVYRLLDTGNVVQLNTGIATAWDIGTAVDLIRKHPVGPKVSDAFTGQ